MTVQSGLVPLLDEQTGRFPDEFAPPSVAADAVAAHDAAEAAGRAQEAAEAAENNAAGHEREAGQIVEDVTATIPGLISEQVTTQIDPKVAAATQAKTDAETAQGAAQTARDDALQAKAQAVAAQEAAAGSAGAAATSAGSAADSAQTATQAKTDAQTALGAVPGAVATEVASQVAPQVAAAVAARDAAVQAATQATTPTQEMVDATIASSVRTEAFPRAILFGTSLEGQNGSLVADAAPDVPLSSIVSSRGWAVWMNQYCGYRIRWVRNAGVGGNTYAQMRARLVSDVLAYESDWVFIGGPANDPGQDRTAEAIIEDLSAMHDAIIADGRRIFQLTCPPSESINTQARREVVDVVNAQIRSLNGKRGIVVSDVWPLVANAATYAPASGMAVDGVHYSLQGAQKIGRRAAQDLTAALPSVPSRNLLEGSSPSIIANPGFRSGIGWTVLGTAPVVTSAAYPGGARAYLDIAGDSTTRGTAGIQFIENIADGRFAVGDRVQASALIRWSDFRPMAVASAPRPWLRVLERLAGGGFVVESGNMLQASGDNRVVTDFPVSGEMLIRTVPFTVADGVDRLYVAVGFIEAASVLVEVSDLQVNRL